MEQQSTQPNQPESNESQKVSLKASQPIIDWHRFFGKKFELVMQEVDIRVHTKMPLMNDPPEADIVLLRTYYPEWTDEERAHLPDGIRDTDASDILIEFKFTESLNLSARQQAISYDSLYKRNTLGQKSHGRPEKRNPESLATFLISAKSPSRETLASLGYAPTEQQGVYRSDESASRCVTVLLLNELPLTTHNAFVKCFASRKKERDKAFAFIQQNDLARMSDDFYWFMQVLKRIYTEKGATDMYQQKEIPITPEALIEYEKNLHWETLRARPKQLILDFIPAQELLELMPTEERLMGLRPEEVFSQYKPEERLVGLQPEEIEQLATTQTLIYKSQQRLVRSLKRKFGDVSDDIVAVIEQTEDVDQLDEWLDEVLDVGTLAEMSFFGD